jgi:hypothetical protein
MIFPLLMPQAVCGADGHSEDRDVRGTKTRCKAKANFDRRQSILAIFGLSVATAGRTMI